jgi:hypothetical protein
MLMQSDLKKLFHELAKNEIAHIDMGGSNITMRMIEHASTFSLSTPVYFGGNFIPKSVRECVSRKAPFTQVGMIKANLSLDEPNFRIWLNYLGSLDHMTGEKLKAVLEEFSWLADEWRLYLDEHDKRDLIHVRNPNP